MARMAGTAAASLATFDSPYTIPPVGQPDDFYRVRNGQPCGVLGIVDPATYDSEECGTLYLIRFADGVTVEAWPEEIGR